MEYVPVSYPARCWVQPSGRAGTLHQATVRDFMRGSRADRRATVSDWFAATAWGPALQAGGNRVFPRMCRAVDDFLPVFEGAIVAGHFRPETTAAAAALSLLWRGQNRWFPHAVAEAVP